MIKLSAVRSIFVLRRRRRAACTAWRRLVAGCLCLVAGSLRRPNGVSIGSWLVCCAECHLRGEYVMRMPAALRSLARSVGCVGRTWQPRLRGGQPCVEPAPRRFPTRRSAARKSDCTECLYANVCRAESQLRIRSVVRNIARSVAGCATDT